MSEPTLTIPAAALAAGVPRRSLYRAVTSGQISSTRGERGRLVDLDEVRAWAAAREDAHNDEDDDQEADETMEVPEEVWVPAAPMAPPGEPELPPPGPVLLGTGTADAVAPEGGGTPPGTGLGTGPEGRLDGAGYARLFDQFAAYVPPEDIVRRLAIVPGVVTEAKAAWDGLRAMPGGGSTDLADLHQAVVALVSRVDACEFQAIEVAKAAAEAFASLRTASDRMARAEAAIAQQGEALVALARRIDAHIIAGLAR